jgi:signal transduction histidine kinase
LSRATSQQLDLGTAFGTWEWDLATDESSFSDELYAILGLSPETSAAGLGTFTSSVHADDMTRVAIALERVRRDGRRAELESRVVRAKTASGAVRFVRLHAWRAPDARRMTVLIEDITSQSAITDRLSSVSTFAAGVAHEINNPLGFLSANLELIAHELEVAGVEATPDRDVLMREARHGIQRIHTIVRGLMTFSRIEPVHHEPLDVNRVLEVALGIANTEIRQRARLVRSFVPLPMVDANAARLGQVFVNLLVNAAQAIPAGRASDHEIAVSTTVDPLGRVVIEVRDSGRGIPRAVGARVFDAFVTTKPTGTGPGLGLTVCRNIVYALGGEIGFESEPGRTTFKVVLPATAVRAEPSVQVVARRGSVLVVDDETVFTRSLRRFLVREHDVAIASDGQDALVRIRAGERFDAIVCDVQMPGLDGDALHRALVGIAVEQAQRMIFITGGSDEGDLLARTTNPCFDKPCDLDALRGAIRRLVG